MLWRGRILANDVKISRLRNWGRRKKKVKLPFFLMTQEEREQELYAKRHVRGRPRRKPINRESK